MSEFLLVNKNWARMKKYSKQKWKEFENVWNISYFHSVAVNYDCVMTLCNINNVMASQRQVKVFDVGWENIK